MCEGVRRLRSWVVAVVLLLAVWLAWPSVTQAAVDLPVLLAQQKPQPVQVQPLRNYALEVLIVIVVFGGALYAICRSSRRS